MRADRVVPSLSDPHAPVLTDGAVCVQEGRVVAVGAYADLRHSWPEVPVVEGAGKALVPGLVDAHSHGRGLSPIRGGLGYDHLERWLLRTHQLPQLGPRLNALISGVRHLRAGFTAIHYLHIPGADPWGELERMEAALSGLRAAGIRVAFSVPARDRNFLTYDDASFLPTLPAGLRKRAEELVPGRGAGGGDAFREVFTEFLARRRGEHTSVNLAPTGPQWCTDDLLATVGELAEAHDVRIHLHTLQTPLQKRYGLRTFKDGLVAHLADIGLLGPRLTLGHAVWLTSRDVDRLVAAQVSVTHHAGCNLNMRNGIAPVDALLRRGVTVAMGMDDKPFSEDEDAFQEMRLVGKLHRVTGGGMGSSCLTTWDVHRMATRNAALVSGFGERCGQLAPGAWADMVLVDLDEICRAWSSPRVDLRELLFHAATARDVDTAIVAGKLVMRDRRLLTVDEEALWDEVRDRVDGDRHGQGLWDELEPYVERFYRGWAAPTCDPYYPINSRM
ncbi:MAG: amidohydrolase family protein [Candidatus Bipolaricaulaceae bacterium]